MSEASNMPEERTKAGHIFPGVAETACSKRGGGNLREPHLQTKKEGKKVATITKREVPQRRKAVGLAHSSSDGKDSKTLPSEGAIL